MKERSPSEFNPWGRLAIVGIIGLIAIVASLQESYLVAGVSVGLLLGFNALSSLDSFHRR